jgi:hypothetical protein
MRLADAVGRERVGHETRHREPRLVLTQELGNRDDLLHGRRVGGGARIPCCAAGAPVRSAGAKSVSPAAGIPVDDRASLHEAGRR